jgi:ATP-dependent DNA helicase RecG
MHIYLFGRKYVPAREGDKIIACGKVKINYNYNNSVGMYPIYFSKDIDSFKRILPVYKKVKGMSDDFLVKTIEAAITTVPPHDYLDDDTVKQFQLIPEHEAYRKIHHPESMEDIDAAKARFVFDDLFMFAFQVQKDKQEKNQNTEFPMKKSDSWTTIAKSLDFSLTQDQIDRLKEMRQFVMEGHRLNALVQGDVGCGKTIIAIYMLALAAENGYQSCLIAPTEILASQHLAEVQKRLSVLPYKIGYLTGNMQANDRKKVIKAIKAGEYDIIIGTHAVLQKSVEFANLGLVIVDEQHRFGVAQRDALLNQDKIPHLVTMSATPIPRTLSMALYAETIQVYNIKQSQMAESL